MSWRGASRVVRAFRTGPAGYLRLRPKQGVRRRLAVHVRSVRRLRLDLLPCSVLR